MDLNDFHRQLRADIEADFNALLKEQGRYPFPAAIFTEVVAKHMAENGMTFDPQVIDEGNEAGTIRIGNAKARINGYSVSEDDRALDLFVTLYRGGDLVEPIADRETKDAAEECLRFFTEAIQKKITKMVDQSSQLHEAATLIERYHESFDDIQIFVLTDGLAKSKKFKPREVSGRTIKLEVMDIERLYRHWSGGKPRDELTVNFVELAGSALPCVHVEGENDNYDYAMAVLPGNVLYHLYESHGARLLEANVRSFLSATGKVNKGILQTLRDNPEKFLAYNNGIVMVADEARFGATSTQGIGLSWLKGMQIVNGGQTTASIYFTKKKYKDTDLSKVHVPAKIVILKTQDATEEEILISDISRYANTQNTVKQSDLSANAPFHVALEKLSNTVYCPDGIGLWFYERAAGSYTTFLAREGKTPTKLKELKTLVVPSGRRVTKTDLAKYLTAWDGRPELASLGGQKNFTAFMADLKSKEERGEDIIPDKRGYQRMIAKVILFRDISSLARPLFKAFQGNVVIYLVAVLAKTYGDRIDLDRIWQQQGLSSSLKDQIRLWAVEVQKALVRLAGERMLSEWAKKGECWNEMKEFQLSAPIYNVPEILAG